MDRHNDGVYPRLKDYMRSAWQILEGRASAVKLSREKQLDETMLKRWADYLKPGEDSQPHLSDWRRATRSRLDEVAAAYQRKFDGRTEQWRKDLERWREQVKRMVKEANMPPPPKPRFRERTDAFYHDVVFKENGPFYLTQEQQEETLSSASRTNLTELRADLNTTS